MIFFYVFGVLVINKQTEDDHFKFLCGIFEVMGGNLQNIEVKQLNQTEFGHLSTQTIWVLKCSIRPCIIVIVSRRNDQTTSPVSNHAGHPLLSVSGGNHNMIGTLCRTPIKYTISLLNRSL